MAKRFKIKKIFTIVLAIFLGIGVITASVFIFKPRESKRFYPTYHVGSIDSTGKHVDSDDSIYSDLFECQGLTIDPNFSSSIKYSVYFYRFDESFVSAIENQTGIYESVDNDVIKYARIVITPDLNNTSKDDHKIRFWQVAGIANDVKVMVNTKQVKIQNLAEVDQNGTWVNEGEEGWIRLVPIDVSNISDLAFVFESGVDNVAHYVKYYYGTSAPSGVLNYLNLNNKLTSKILILDVPDSANNIFISVKSDVQLKIYKYN